MLRMLTTRTLEEIEAVEKTTAERPEQQAAQKMLSMELTSLVHGEQAALDAKRASEALFGREIAELDEATLLDVMSEAPSTEVSATSFEGDGKALVELLVETSLSGSKGAARNDLKGGGIYVNNQRVGDAGATVKSGDALHGKYVVLRKGKKNFHLVKVA